MMCMQDFDMQSATAKPVCDDWLLAVMLLRKHNFITSSANVDPDSAINAADKIKDAKYKEFVMSLLSWRG